MARKRRSYKKSSKCPEPINTMLDLAGALTLGLYTKHKIKKDFANGEGEESAKAASMVFGLGSMSRGSRGIINLGGLIGLNSALKDIERRQQNISFIPDEPFIDKVSDNRVIPQKKLKKNLWREYCEDGSIHGINPMDYETADEYSDALATAKGNSASFSEECDTLEVQLDSSKNQTTTKHVWRKYCEDGAAWGINPMDYETADDYEDALNEAKLNKHGGE